jgi:glyoxylase-like metal-dependent hydrolase (beta-lactamase superfamily II)
MPEIAKGVFLAGGTDVNWVLVREGSDLTLIDAGWFGDLPAVERSVRDAGARPEDVRAILLTHAHVDHVGGASRWHQRYGTPVYASATEAAHARREFLEQATPLDILPRAWRPGVLAWSLRILRAGATRPIAVPDAQPFPVAPGPLDLTGPLDRPGSLDLPGRPVPVACPGHTSGHSAYLLPQAGVLVSGDALITGHPWSPVSGPQLLPDPFTHSPADAVAALEVLRRLDAGILAPGHGRPWTGPMGRAVDQAAARADTP